MFRRPPATGPLRYPRDDAYTVRDDPSPSATWLIPIALWTVALPLILGFIWVVIRVLFNGMSFRQTYNLWLQRSFLMDNAILWLVLLLWAVGCLVILILNFSSPTRTFKVAVIASIVIMGLFLSQLFLVIWDNDKDEANVYNAATVFHVDDTAHPPPSVNKLLDGARPGNDQRCKLVGKHSTPSCIVQGSLPLQGFEPRVSSVQAAARIISKTAGDNPRVSPMDDTMTYLYGSGSGTGKWSAILDGSGREQDLYGVAEWDGVHPANVCTFKDGFTPDRAFSGARGNSLPNLLAEKFPNLFFNTVDVWGYCKGVQPVVVIPVSEQAHVSRRSYERPAGVLVYDGTSDFFRYQRSVTAGQFPGPVYPNTTAALQRERTQWAAGRKNMDRFGFGYEVSSLDSQAGNASEYLLRSKADGHLYWVTPVTPRNSSSERIIAYTLVPADRVEGGTLNQLDVYSFSQTNPWNTDLQTLNQTAQNYMVDNAPNFRTNGGTISEFTPMSPDLWRAFGEINGTVKYLLDISPSGKFEPKLIRLDETTGAPTETIDGGTPTPGIPALNCGTSEKKLARSDLATCIKRFADELASRKG